MNSLPRISVVIVAQDEERTIGRVLAAIKDIAAEIVFVDSGSTDRTVEIAESFGARIIHQKWLGYAAQKNFAIDQASCEWILSLDADEIMTPQVVAELSERLGADQGKYVGYKIPRMLFIGDTAVPHGGFYPDAQLRLFQKGSGKFNDRAVHEAVKVDGPVATLNNMMLHYAYKDVDGFAAAMEKYARLSVVHAQKTGYKRAKTSTLNLLVHPIWTFVYRFIIRGGFLDGAIGLKLNMIYADYVRKKIAYLREAERSVSKLAAAEESK